MEKDGMEEVKNIKLISKLIFEGKYLKGKGIKYDDEGDLLYEADYKRGKNIIDEII